MEGASQEQRGGEHRQKALRGGQADCKPGPDSLEFHLAPRTCTRLVLQFALKPAPSALLCFSIFLITLQNVGSFVYPCSFSRSSVVCGLPPLYL